MFLSIKTDLWHPTHGRMLQIIKGQWLGGRGTFLLGAKKTEMVPGVSPRGECCIGWKPPPRKPIVSTPSAAPLLGKVVNEKVLVSGEFHPFSDVTCENAAFKR